MRQSFLSSVRIRPFIAVMLFAVPAFADSSPVSGTGTVFVMGENISVNTPYGTIAGGYCCGGWLSFLVDPSTGEFSLNIDIATVNLNDECTGPSLTGCEGAELTGNASGVVPILPHFENIGGSNVWILPAQDWEQVASVNVFWDFYDKINPATGHLYPEISVTWTGPATFDFSDISSARCTVGGDICVNGGHVDVIFPAPEPSALVLLSTGLAAIAGAVRRKLGL